jgi:hypothetical protein
MTTKHDIRIPQAGTYLFVVDVVDGPASLAGYTADGQIRQVKASTEVLADLPSANFTVDDVNRQVVLEITDEVTGAYDWSIPAVYDIYIEGPEGDRWRLIEGVATLSKTVTREA